MRDESIEPNLSMISLCDATVTCVNYGLIRLKNLPHELTLIYTNSFIISLHLIPLINIQSSDVTDTKIYSLSKHRLKKKRPYVNRSIYHVTPVSKVPIVWLIF